MAVAGGGSRSAKQANRLVYLLLAYPGGMLVVFFLVPLIMLVVFSVYRNIPGGGWETAFTWDNYVRAFERGLYRDRLVFTLQLSALTALICLAMGYPFTYYLARRASPLVRRIGLAATISTLWLTYVVRSYAWSVLLSSTSGIGRLLFWLGLTERPVGYAPGYVATLIGMVYAFLPFMILSLYGSLRAVDPSMEEASMNLGARPWRTFWHVVLPLSWPGAASGTLLVFLLAMGNYVVPSILGQPAQWTMPVIITNQVMYESNVPFGAAISVVLMAVLGLVLFAAGKLLGAARMNPYPGRRDS
ncbi:MAG: ABC transporter permease [Firmicutes bacterium]|nr:ABC transporter permease [Bacillota bacterium]